MPAAVVPVSPHVHGVVGNDYEVEDSRWDRVVTSRAEILLHGLVGLDRRHGYVPKIAHAMTPMVARTATTNMAMSSALF